MTSNYIESHSEQIEALHADFETWWAPTWEMIKAYTPSMNRHDARHVAWLAWLAAQPQIMEHVRETARQAQK